MTLLTSMTGYGRAENKLAKGVVVVEMKSVNHRYGEVAMRFARPFMSLEEEIRHFVIEKISRGRVEIFLHLSESLLHRSRRVYVDEGVLEVALGLLKRVSKEASVDFDPPSTGDLLAISGLFVTDEAFSLQDDLVEVILLTARQSLEALVAMRRKEGERLHSYLWERLLSMRHLTQQLMGRTKISMEQYRHQLTKRVKQTIAVTSEEENRIAFEVALVAERIAVDEELMRLTSHIQQFDALLQANEEPVGRKMDFLLQEMHREINTTGAKCTDSVMTELVLQAKHVLEQMREQVQNIE
nr:YicC family protein [Bacilli bacterium]